MNNNDQPFRFIEINCLMLREEFKRQRPCDLYLEWKRKEKEEERRKEGKKEEERRKRRQETNWSERQNERRV